MLPYIAPSGGDDFIGIQCLLDAVKYRHVFAGVETPTSGAAIQLEGHYRISRPLVAGDPLNEAVNCVGIVSQGGTVIEYTGPRTDAYALTMRGNTVGGKGGEARDILRNVKIVGNSACRGVRLDRQFHFHGVRGLWIEGTRQLAFDVDTCWKSYLEDVHITRVTGCGLRMRACDNMRVNNLRIGAIWGVWHSVDGDRPHVPHSTPAKSKQLWLDEMREGEQFARTKYGEGYCEDWPDDMPRSEQCVMHLNTGNVRFQNVMFEQCGMGDRPLIFSAKERGRSLTFEHLYLESNYNRDCKVLIQGHSSGGRGDTKNFIFDVIECNEGITGEVRCKSFARCEGVSYPHISAVRIRDISARGLSDCILALSGPGTYYGCEVGHARTDNRIPADRWIACDVGATYTQETPLGLDHLSAS